MMRRLRSLGPGLLVSAAFIGPGTVTTASVAGADFGFALLWVLVFSILATILLQEMSARLGLVTRQGLGNALRTTFQNPVLSALAVLLVLAAIFVGTSAFQVGNVSGAALALESLAGADQAVWSVSVGALAIVLLAIGAYRILERILILLVAVMAVVFVVTAVMVGPNLGELLQGIFVPSLPSGATITAIALIGTTVVPYNLFLHASAVKEKWGESVPIGEALSQSRVDTSLSITLGGIVTLAIVSTAAAAFFAAGREIEDAATMAEQLEPLLGPAAKYFFGIGLLAAGVTSSITAPLAAAYATTAGLGWSTDLRSWRFRAVWLVVILFGTTLAALGQEPVQAILFAQATNGILLPVVAIFLLFVMNRSDLLGEHRNRTAGNIAGVVVVLVASGLGVFQLLQALGIAPS